MIHNLEFVLPTRDSKFRLREGHYLCTIIYDESPGQNKMAVDEEGRRKRCWHGSQKIEISD